MRKPITLALAGALLCLLPTLGWADLTPYSQPFEGLDQADPNALANDGWWVFGNVFHADWSYAYGYGSYPAPNGGGGFCAIDAGQGGVDQGAQQLSVYNDYNNGDHGNGKWIEANTFQEQVVGPADVGTTWRVSFDAKRGNISGRTTAKAFFKTLDPNRGYLLTNFIWIDMTSVPDVWGSYSLDIFIDSTLPGQILQFGFLSTATGYEGSGVFYDNIEFGLAPLAVSLDVRPGGCPNPINTRSKGLLPVAVLGTAEFDVSQIDVATVRLEGVAPLRSDYDDVAEPYLGGLCGCTEEGPDGWIDLALKFKNKDIVHAIGVRPGGDYIVTLTGNLLDGTPIEGQDCVIGIGDPKGPEFRIELDDDNSVNSNGTSTFDRKRRR
jgi:hypothetical protein